MKISRSAQILAARRAVDAESTTPLIGDEQAGMFATEEFLNMARSEAETIHYVLMRHRILEDQVFKNNAQFDHLVILGAGLDTKFLRYADTPTKIVEVDTPDMAAFKRSKLQKAKLPVPDTIECSVITHSDLGAVLT